jgi:hypothetical protein
MNQLRSTYAFHSCVALAVASALSAGCSAAPEDTQDALDSDQESDTAENREVIEQAHGASAGALFNERSPNQRHELTITYPHEGIMPRGWARFGGQNMWHVNVNYHRCTSQNTEVCRTGNNAVWSRNVRNYHVVWCREGGASCSPPPGKLICLYVWDSTEGEVWPGAMGQACFDNWDTFNQRAWEALVSRIQALAPGLLTAAQVGLSALGAVLSWMHRVGTGFAPISVNLPADDATAKIGTDIVLQPFVNDPGIRPADKIFEVIGPNKDFAAILPGARRLKLRADTAGDYRVRYCVKRADPKPGWQSGWKGTGPRFNPSRRCGTVRFTATNPPPEPPPPNCTNPEAYNECVAGNYWPPSCCANFHCY